MYFSLSNGLYVLGSFASELNLQQDRKCTYNVTYRRVRAKIVAMKNDNYYIFCVLVCRCTDPSCKAIPAGDSGIFN